MIKLIFKEKEALASVLKLKAKKVKDISRMLVGLDRYESLH